MSLPWLVVIDPQRVFADPASDWGSPMFAAAQATILDLSEQHGPDRTVVTRWVPGVERVGSWQAYFEAWPFADRPATDPMFDVVPALAGVSTLPSVDAPTFGKWPALSTVLGGGPELVLTGVSTDCCVLSTALAAADAGATVRVVASGCAGSTREDHERALAVMALYAPQIVIE